MQGQTYSGSARMLLIAFHLGATCARVCYSILDPGTEIEIRDIERFPTGGTSTVQYIVFYDRKGNVHAIGGNENDPIEEVAGEEQLLRAPVDWSTPSDSPNNPPLPFGKCPEDVLPDFLTHLNTTVHTYIRDVHPDIGRAVVDSAAIHHTIIRPSERYEATIRAAAKKAGIIKDTVRMTFLTEEKAYFEAYLNEGRNSLMGEEGGVCIVNVDHGPLKFSSFSYKGWPRQVEEITESRVYFKGYFTVNEEARTNITSLLKGSNFEKEIPAMLESFDKTTKPAFRANNNDSVFIRFGSARDKDLKRRIKAGKLTLEAKTIASFFEPLIKCTVKGVLNQVQVARVPISCVLLFGEGANSDYIFQETKRRLGNELPEVQVLRLDRPGPSQVPRGGVARAIRCIHELPANVSNKRIAEELSPAEHAQPVLPTATDAQANSPPEAVDEAKNALKILANIIKTQRCRESQISELREKIEKLTVQAEEREIQYLALREENIHLNIRLKELEEWRKMVMIGIEGIQRKTYEIMEAECPVPGR